MNLIIFFTSKPHFYESWYFKYKSIYNFHLLSKQGRILCQNNYFSSLDNLLILAGLPVKTHCLGMFYTEFSHIIWNLFKKIWQDLVLSDLIFIKCRLFYFLWMPLKLRLNVNDREPPFLDLGSSQRSVTENIRSILINESCYDCCLFIETFFCSWSKSTFMDHGDSPASSLQSTGDTGQLLQELLNLQKSNGINHIYPILWMNYTDKHEMYNDLCCTEQC